MSTVVLAPKVGVSHLPFYSVTEVALAEAMTEAKVIFYIYIYSEIS